MSTIETGGPAFPIQAAKQVEALRPGAAQEADE